ncbi:MAG: acyltransferase [bacterium]|nr:acyltransferase [bacterium]
MAADTIEVGDDVIMAWGIFVLDSDNHSLYWADRQFDVERCRKDYLETNGRFIGRSHDWSKVRISKVTIKNKSWIGFNSIILKGVTIGEGAVVGAGSVVTRNVRPWYVAAGYPVQHLRKLPRSRNG